ncbi:MAG: hypothetical protein IJ660_02155, partial [Alphaproteobacteria bacterium]|nr:hypothetical protein [Alphaproteobacteria bacterium]
YYGCGTSGCKSGYIADGKQCVLNQCLDYFSSSELTNCKTKNDSCNRGDTTVYKCTECNSGYSLNTTGKCDANQCEGYFTATELTNCKTKNDSCNRGDTTVYKCTECNSGYSLNTIGKCETIVCPVGQILPSQYWCSSAWRCLMPGG